MPSIDSVKTHLPECHVLDRSSAPTELAFAVGDSVSSVCHGGTPLTGTWSNEPRPARARMPSWQEPKAGATEHCNGSAPRLRPGYLPNRRARRARRQPNINRYQRQSHLRAMQASGRTLPIKNPSDKFLPLALTRQRLWVRRSDPSQE